jgi:hypothetical protein
MSESAEQMHKRLCSVIAAVQSPSRKDAACISSQSQPEPSNQMSQTQPCPSRCPSNDWGFSCRRSQLGGLTFRSRWRRNRPA